MLLQLACENLTPLDVLIQLLSGWVLASSAGGPGFNPR